MLQNSNSRWVTKKNRQAGEKAQPVHSLLHKYEDPSLFPLGSMGNIQVAKEGGQRQGAISLPGRQRQAACGSLPTSQSSQICELQAP